MGWKHQLGPLQNEEADRSKQARMLDRAARLLEWSIALVGGTLGLFVNHFFYLENGYGLIIQFPPLLNYVAAFFLLAGAVMLLSGLGIRWRMRQQLKT